ATAQPTIRPMATMAIIRLSRSTPTHQHAPTATVGQLPPLSQPPLLLVRLSLQQMQTLPMPIPLLPTLDITLVQLQPPRVNRPRRPSLRHQSIIPLDSL